MTRMGRKPLATGHVDRLQGSEPAKQRLTVLLETLRGELPVPEACARLGIGESRFHALRGAWLQEALELLEPRPLGRPPQAADRSAVTVAHPGLGSREPDAASAVDGRGSAAGTGRGPAARGPRARRGGKKGAPRSRLRTAAARAERRLAPRVARHSGRRTRRPPGLGDCHRLASRSSGASPRGLLPSRGWPPHRTPCRAGTKRRRRSAVALAHRVRSAVICREHAGQGAAAAPAPSPRTGVWRPSSGLARRAPSTSAESGDDASAGSCRAGETASLPTAVLASARRRQHAARTASGRTRRRGARPCSSPNNSRPKASPARVPQRISKSCRGPCDPGDRTSAQPLGEPEPRGRPWLGSQRADAQRGVPLLAPRHGSGHRPARLAGSLPDRAAVHPGKICWAVTASVWRRRYAQHGFELTWHFAGTVWAMDFTQPLQPIDGVFPYLLAIRDLASHCQLAWRPVRGETAEDVLPVLQELFADVRPALGPQERQRFRLPRRDRCSELLCEAAVAQLFSPVRQPQYNGALERSNGVLKTYTHHHAISAGHPFRWTSEDVEHAQHLANTISRPWGARGPSPDEAWQLAPADPRRGARPSRRR